MPRRVIDYEHIDTMSDAEAQAEVDAYYEIQEVWQILHSTWKENGIEIDLNELQIIDKMVDKLVPAIEAYCKRRHYNDKLCNEPAQAEGVAVLYINELCDIQFEKHKTATPTKKKAMIASYVRSANGLWNDCKVRYKEYMQGTIQYFRELDADATA